MSQPHRPVIRNDKMLRHPNGALVTFGAGRASEWRTWRNLERDIRHGEQGRAS